MKYAVEVAGRQLEVELGEDVRVDGRVVSADLQRIAGTARRSLVVDGVSHRLVANRVGPGLWDIHVDGRTLRVEALDERTRTIREMTAAVAGPRGPSTLRAPMPGMVVQVEVAEGDEVEPGRGLVIVEAMKMENELRADAPGRVARVCVAAGDPVEKGQPLIEFEPLEGDV